METLDLLNFVKNSQTPGGFILIVAIILALVSGLFSKAAADYGGILGQAARAIGRHKDRAIAADEQSNATRLDRLEETIGRLDAEVGQLHLQDRVHHEYQLYVAGYWRKLQFWAVEKGVELPPPPMMTYPDWKLENYPDDA